jgi:tetratricopeptide (TPR) repeat protein
MKIKPLYLYGISFVIIITVIIFVGSGNNSGRKIPPQNGIKEETETMPNDAIHNGVANNKPNRNNVRKEFWDKLDRAKTNLEANPTDTLLMREYAELLAMSHKTNDAIKIYQKILAVDPNRIDILLAEGATFFNGQNFKMAEIVTKKILAIEPGNLEARYNLGVIAAAEGNNEKAKTIWQKIAKKFPDTDVGKLSASSIEKLSSR